MSKSDFPRNKAEFESYAKAMDAANDQFSKKPAAAKKPAAKKPAAKKKAPAKKC